MSLESDLARVRGLGSAKDGTLSFWHQRITAIALIPLSVWFVAGLVALARNEHLTSPGELVGNFTFVFILFAFGWGDEVGDPTTSQVLPTTSTAARCHHRSVTW